MSSNYKVIITGIKTGMDRREVVSALARLFKKPPEFMDKKLQATPWLVKSGLSLPEAEKYKSVLEKAGTACSIEQEKAKLSMEMEDQPEASATPERTPKRTCPKCGYEAFDDNDPLLTAFDGQGECPNCGVILKKTAPEVESPAAPGAVSEPGEPSTEQPAPRGFPVKLVAIATVVVVAAVVLIWFFMGGEEAPPQKTASKPAAKTAETTGTTDEAAPVQCVINPGNPQVITLSGLAPFFHESHQTGEIDPIMRISQNPWKERGVDVKVSSVRLTPVQVDLWELGYGGGLYKLPNFPKEEIKIMEMNSKLAGPNSFFNSVRYTEYLLRLIEIGELPESEFEELVKDQKHADLRKSTYTVYQMDINLTFSAPNGVADFTSDMGARSGYIFVVLTGILTEDGPESGGVDYQYGMKLRGHQNVGENTMTVQLPEDNEYMLYNFGITCR